MKISLKNIGKVKEADVEINGLTVIAGANSTGKSTVGKALFAVFNACFDINERIKAMKSRSIAKELTYKDLFQIDTPQFNFTNVYNSIAGDIIDNVSLIKEFSDDSSNKEMISFKEFLYKYNDMNKNSSFYIDISQQELDELIKKIREKLNITMDTLKKTVLLQNLLSEFYGQINNIYFDEEGEIKLTIKNVGFTVSIQNNKIIKLKNELNLEICINYIDDPCIIHNLRENAFDNTHKEHKNFLKYQMSNLNRLEDLLDKILIDEKFKKISEQINSICDGKMYFENNNYVYRKNGESQSLKVENLATGLKTFLIIKTLLLTGAIRENSSLILDEPEIHLHPEWQLVFAELLVLLQKEFNLHILLNTHSPYFLRAIQVYSAKHEIADKCKYYLARLEDNFAVIDDVSDDIEQIYKSLAKPLQTLRNEEYSNEC